MMSSSYLGVAFCSVSNESQCGFQYYNIMVFYIKQVSRGGEVLGSGVARARQPALSREEFEAMGLEAHANPARDVVLRPHPACHALCGATQMHLDVVPRRNIVAEGAV